MRQVIRMKAKRKYFRKCGRCGESREQHEMHRTEQSMSGWLCDECYEILHLDYDIEEW